MAYAERQGKYWRAVWYTGEIDEKGRKVRAWESGFRTKTAARKHAEKQQGKLAAGVPVDSRQAKAPLREWWARWYAAQDYAPNTMEAYASAWSTRIGPRWGGVPLASIRPIDVDEWLKQLRREVSASTVNIAAAAMRGCLDDAVRNGLIAQSPMPPPAKGKRRRASAARAQEGRRGIVLPREALDGILAALPRDDDRLLVITALYTGMRWSEVAGMRRRFLELDGGDKAAGRAPSGAYTLDPAEGALHEDVHGQPYYGPPKSGPGRIVDLPAFLVLLLLAYLETLPPQEDCPEVFPAVHGGPRRYDTWRSGRWRRACDGLPARVTPSGLVREAVPAVCEGARFHDLKHTNKAIMNDGRVHPVMQDYVLGHVTPGTPGRYAHPTETMRAARLAALEAHWAAWQGAPASGPQPASATIPPRVDHRAAIPVQAGLERVQVGTALTLF